MNAKKYEPGDPAEEPGLMIHYDSSGPGPFEVGFSGESYADTQEGAEVLMQEYAVAIADNVHGEELRALRRFIEERAEMRTEQMREILRLTGEITRLRSMLPARATCGGIRGIDAADGLRPTVIDSGPMNCVVIHRDERSREEPFDTYYSISGQWTDDIDRAKRMTRREAQDFVYKYGGDIREVSAGLS